VVGAAWRAAMRIVAGVGDLVQRTGDGHTGRVLDGRTIGRSGDAVCDLHRARGDEERRFLGWASKPRSMVCSRFGLKTTGMVSPGLASKSLGRFLPFWHQNRRHVFLGLGLKTDSYGSVVWASKSPRRLLDLGLKTKRATVCQLRHKTDGRM
jgi:hypothetical protein